MTDELEPLLTLREAAWALGITRDRLVEWSNRGVIQPVEERGPRRAWYYRVAEVERVRQLVAGRSAG